jgi:hypothetical protein
MIINLVINKNRKKVSSNKIYLNINIKQDIETSFLFIDQNVSYTFSSLKNISEFVYYVKY